MEYYNLKTQLKSANNDTKNFLHNKYKNNKFVLDNPIGYFSYSDNDISDKLSDKYSDYEENKNNENLLKDKPYRNNYIINTQDYIKNDKEKNGKKIYNNNVNKDINKNNMNNNHHHYLIKNNNHNYSIIKSFNKSNDTYLKYYINKKNFSNNNNNKNNQSGKKFEKIKNNKKRKILSSNENKVNKDNRLRPNHIKNKSLKSIINNTKIIIDERIEHKDKFMNENTYNNNRGGKLFINKNINKNINYTYFVLNSKHQLNNKNSHNNEARRTALNKIPFQNISFQSMSNLNKYKNYNSTSKDKDPNKPNSHIYLRNSLCNYKNDFDFNNYFCSSHECLDSNTLNPELRYSGNFINNVYIPVNFGMSKMHNKKENKFSRTFIDIKDIKNNEFNEIYQKNDKSLKNKIASNSQQKSYQKKLLNKKNIIKNKSNNNFNYKKKGLTIKVGFDKNMQDFVVHKQTKANSTSNIKVTSPIASNINNNLTNTEKISRDKYDYIKNKIDFKKKISFNNSKNNTISNSKTIFNKSNNILIPVVKNKIEKKNNTKIQKKITIYQKRKISNNKYNQQKIKKENKRNENKNTSLLIKNFYTDNKLIKNINYKFIEQHIKKIDLFKFISSEKKSNILNNKKACKKKIKDNTEQNERNSSRSDNAIITNYLKKKINNNNSLKSKVYIKGILKKWKINAENMTKPVNIKELNLKIINKFSFQKKYFNFFIKKYKVKNYFITKRFKIRIPINKLCVFSKNIILKDDNNKANNSKEETNQIKENTHVSMPNNININGSKLNDSNKENLNNNNFNKNLEIFLEEDENENEDFKVEEYEERHIDSLLNLKNSNIINNSNSAMNINNIIIEENLRQDNKIVTLGKEDQLKADPVSLNNPKMSLKTNEKHFLKIGEGLEKLCRIFFRNLEKKNAEINRKNMEKELKIKKEKSDSNIKNQSKYSSLLSSTIQNWNDIDKKKHYKKEDIFLDNDINIKKNKKYKNHAKLLNINKAFSEEKDRDIFRRTVNLNSKFFFDKNNKNFDKIIENTNMVNNGEGIKELYNKKNNYYTLNNQKEKYIELLNILSIKNYNSIFEKILNLLNNNNNSIINININNYEILLNNQFIFIEVLVDKSIKEKSYMPLYAKLTKDLYFKLLSNFIGLNKKKVKRENLKSIICIQCKQKFDECDIITLLNLEKNKYKDKEYIYEAIKYKLLGIIDFIYELINIKMISQKMGLEYLDTLHKRIINFDNNIKELEDKNYLKTYKYLYIEGEVSLLEKLSKIIIERKKPKHVQNFKNFIEDNIIPMVENNKKNNEEISNYLICRIINLLEKLKNNELFHNIKLIKIEEKNRNNNNNKKINIKENIKNINDNINKYNITKIDNTKKNNENNKNKNIIKEDKNNNNKDKNINNEDKNKNNEIKITKKNDKTENNEIKNAKKEDGNENSRDNKDNIIINNNENSKNNELIDNKEKEKIDINLKSDENSENMNLLKKEIENYMIFLSEYKIEKNKDISYDVNDEFNWSIVDDLVVVKKISLGDIVIYYIKICTNIIDDTSKIFKANEYIKNIINYYSYNLNSENINIMHLKMVDLFLDIDNICISNSHMYEIMGYLLFILLSNECKFFNIKDLNSFIDKDINTRINIAKTVKFTIISYGQNWKKYYNIFKKANLFKENDIFDNYISNALKKDGFKI